MEKKTNFTELPCILALAIVSLIESTMATDYKVGGSNGGWDTSTDLKAWARSKKFYPGDTLTFMYEPFHDLLEVSEANFEICSTENYFAFYTGGRTTIDLTSPGSRYFICGVTGHCTAGMKLQIDTISPSSPPPPISSSPPPPPHQPPSPPPKKNNMAPPKSPPSNPPKLAPKASKKPSPSKLVPIQAPIPAPAPLMAPAPTPSTSMAVGIDQIVMVMWAIVSMVAFV